MCMNFNNKHYLHISIQLLIPQKYLFSNKVSNVKLRDYATLIITIFFGGEALEVVIVPCKVYGSGDLSSRYPIPGTVLRSPSDWPAM